MLPTSAIVASALLGDDSVLAPRLQPGTLVIDMSSSQPLETLELGKRLGDRGIRLIDAPVSGGVPGAIDGTLTIMVGADADADAEEATPVLEALGSRIYRAGALGAGHALKALNNFVGASGFAAACEALLTAESYGLDPEVFLDVLNVSTGRNFSTHATLPGAVLTGKFDTGFSLALMTKDVGIAAALAHGLGQPAVMADTVRDRLQAALDELGPHVDHSAAIKHWSGRPDYRGSEPISERRPARE
jgi:3-hydroxyisobutyrate dehydrogenase